MEQRKPDPEEIAGSLPFLRRYSRALTGSQATGDGFTLAVLETLLDDNSGLDSAVSVKVELFRRFHQLWTTLGAPLEQDNDLHGMAVHRHMQRLPTQSRAALVLQVLEKFDLGEIATILDCSETETRALLEAATAEMDRPISGKVMLIEDEPIIALSIQALVEDIGLRIVGIARTRSNAIEMAAREDPDLILSDLQLADGSSGLDAVTDILRTMGDRPVVFITAYPERLLTGTKPELAFLVPKPFDEAQLRIAINHAMFFSQTAGASG